MKKSGVAEKYVRVVQDMCERSRTVVSCAVGQTEEFKVEVGLHQGSALSPFLFAIVMDQLSEEARTTVKKLAVVPKWKNYGLRIFGFIHPYKDGDFQFAISSDDNSELWLSSDENPLNAKLLVYVGKHGSEWTAPGEFSKFRSQTSKSVQRLCSCEIRKGVETNINIKPSLMASRRYYFEILHKQDDKGSDHVEVGWRPFLPGLKYDVIDSAYISLYTAGKMGKRKDLSEFDKAQIVMARPLDQSIGGVFLGCSVPMMDQSRLEKVLPSCVYSPTYVVRDFPIARYQGLQFVYLSYVYPNDFTRLTHMERENKCFYRESPVYLEKFGFYKYMKMDEENDDRPLFFPNPDDFLEEEEIVDLEEDSNHLPDRRTSNTSVSDQLSSSSFSTISTKQSRRWIKGEEHGRHDDYYKHTTQENKQRRTEKDRKLNQHRSIIEADHEALTDHRESKEEADETTMRIHGQRSLKWVPLSPVQQSNKISPLRLIKTSLKNSHRSSLYTLASHILSNPASQEKEVKSSRIYITKAHPPKSTPKPPVEIFPGVFLYQTASGKKLVDFSSRWKSMKRHDSWPKLDHKSPAQQLKHSSLLSSTVQQVKDFPPSSITSSITDFTPSSADLAGTNPSDKRQPVKIRTTRASEMVEESQHAEGPELKDGATSEYSYEDDEPRPGWTEEAINWQRTFSVNPVDFELLRSDWNDLRCNVSGNLQLTESEALEVISQYVERINKCNRGIYSLLRIVNVEKRRDPARGSRYLVELELMEAGDRVVRLSEYIYFLHQRSRHEEIIESREVNTLSAPAIPSKSPTSSSSSAQSRPSTAWRGHWPKPLLCQPIMLQWRHDVMVHIVVPEPGRGGSSLSRDAQTSLSPGTSSSSSGGTPRRSQASRETWSLQRVLGLPRGLFPVGHARNTSPGRRQRRHPKQMPEPPLPPFDVEEQRLYSELLPGDRAPYPTSKGAPRHPTEEAQFGRLFPGSYPFSHDPELMTIVKNQARWVQQFISDMEFLHRETKDENFNIIIVDFESEDMDVEQALRESTVPRYEYLRREGNFERSSGLQMGVDTIADSHSIVFLCDLHIHFPMSILESIRKHCVEGRLAFAPIVMRLDCGSSPLEPDGTAATRKEASDWLSERRRLTGWEKGGV
ncbi:hypothetical protein QTP70_008385 [Hemibagrus guttatus]|uniref:Hexosyltransferase n=1 Tax=Hemibagrus guttatus TaxID=175788 RepID=A0AAE0PX19_9TELE|nr:hypothetical protein QTP70_008385 [Hemibagrus guttatus]